MALKMNNKIISVICQAMWIPTGIFSPRTGIKKRSIIASTNPTVMHCRVFSLIFIFYFW